MNEPKKRVLDAILIECEGCDVVVYQTSAPRVRLSPNTEHTLLLKAYENHRKKTGKACKAPPFETILDAARAEIVPTKHERQS